jgi:hypothetical protein
LRTSPTQFAHLTPHPSHTPHCTTPLDADHDLPVTRHFRRTHPPSQSMLVCLGIRWCGCEVWFAHDDFQPADVGDFCPHADRVGPLSYRGDSAEHIRAVPDLLLFAPLLRFLVRSGCGGVPFRPPLAKPKRSRCCELGTNWKRLMIGRSFFNRLHIGIVPLSQLCV